MALPLQGIRVLDLATIVAGPLGTTMLADMGADVIKIEAPVGDDCRHMGPRVGVDSGTYVGVNRNKRGIVLDLRQPAALEVYYKLVRRADIIVTNMRPAAKHKLKIDYDSTRPHNPQIIYVSVSTFGQSGPYSQRPGIDPVAQAMSGLMGVTGEPGGRPLKAGAAVADATVSAYVAYGAMVALWARQQQGIGQHLEISLLDSLFHLQAPLLGRYFLTGDIPPRVGNGSPDYGPYNTYVSRDGIPIQVACFSDKWFQNFCQAVNKRELATDPRFSTNEQRMAHTAVLEALMQDACAQYDAPELLRRLEAADVIHGPVLSYAQTVDDPQIRHNQMVQEVDHANVGKLRVHGLPIKMHTTPGAVRLAPPTLGQHTEEILAELGYSAADIAALYASHAITPRIPKPVSQQMPAVVC
jgi:crotonobetainyl-CoA:carnitine CoA-transferase CaiB-like acyl-CoA transferase